MKKILTLMLVILIPAIALAVKADDGGPSVAPTVTGDVPKESAEEVCVKPAPEPELDYKTALERSHEMYRLEKRAAWDNYKDSVFAARSKRDKVVEAECKKSCDAVKNAWNDLRDSVENAKVKDARSVARAKWRALKAAVCANKNSASKAVDDALSDYEKEMKVAKKTLKDTLKNAHAKLEQAEDAAYVAWEKSKNQKVGTLEVPKAETEVKTEEAKPENGENK